MEYDRSSVLLDMWMAYEALSQKTGADRVAIEELLLLGLARLERDQKSLIPPDCTIPQPIPIASRTPPKF
jgi:hypothetical protein